MQKDKFEKLVDLDKKLTMIGHIAATLEYDGETVGLPRSGAERSRQIGWIKEQHHALVSSKEMGSLLEACGANEEHKQGDGETDFEKAIIKSNFKQYLSASRIPSSFVAQKEELMGSSYQKWVKGRETGDDKDYLDNLNRVIDCVKTEKEYTKEKGQTIYDALLDEFEPGMTQSVIDPLFQQIETDLTKILKTYKDVSVDNSFLQFPYDEKKQEEFALTILRPMGFDFTRGQLSYAPHPFTETLGEDDVRITTRYTDPSVMDPLCSTIHEGGHALYEMGANSGILKGTSLGQGVSCGIHESMSRFFENIILKDPDFWAEWYPLFCKTFPSQTAGVSLSHFTSAINKVSPSFIRVNADEATYGLHIILRYKVEKALFDGTIKTRQIPEMWNDLFTQFFGISITDKKDGYIQDVHWSTGDFGYFPSYELGNLYGAQILQAMKKDLNPLNSYYQKDKLCEITQWLDAHIYRQGGLYEPQDLLTKVSKKALDASIYTEYLTNKLSKVYDM